MLSQQKKLIDITVQGHPTSYSLTHTKLIGLLCDGVGCLCYDVWHPSIAERRRRSGIKRLWLEDGTSLLKRYGEAPEAMKFNRCAQQWQGSKATQLDFNAGYLPHPLLRLSSEEAAEAIHCDKKKGARACIIAKSNTYQLISMLATSLNSPAPGRLWEGLRGLNI